jgi:hypothetical protein
VPAEPPSDRRRTDTVAHKNKILAAIRTLTDFNRIQDVLPALDLEHDDVTFVVSTGSMGEGLIDRYIQMNQQAKLIDWEEARRRNFDLVIAAHANVKLADLNDPRMILPHGAGLARKFPLATLDKDAPVGMASGQLICDGVVIPDVIGLPHDNLLDVLRKHCPEAADRATRIGDPTFDRLLANRPLRRSLRRQLKVGDHQRLVLITSTWGPYSSLGEHRALINALVAQLPMDQFKVAVILHPNIWAAERKFNIRNMFRDALNSGLLIISPDNDSWQGALLAADIVLGDHGSVGFYGAALGYPFLLTARGLEELDESSPRIELNRLMPALDVHGDLRAQVDYAFDHHPREQALEITGRTLGDRGKSLELIRAAAYTLLGQPRPMTKPWIQPIEELVSITRKPTTAHRVTLVPVNADTIRLERFPALMIRDPAREVPGDQFLVGDSEELEENTRSNSEVGVDRHVHRSSMVSTALRELREQYPLALMIAVATRTGCTVRSYHHKRDFDLVGREGTDEDGDPPDASILAVGLYGRTITARRTAEIGTEFRVELSPTSIVTVRVTDIR